MKILFAASEIFPFARTGGLGDVVTALTNELSMLGHDVRLVLPGYPELIEVLDVSSVHHPDLGFSGMADYDLLCGRLPGVASEVFLVRSDRLFSEGEGLYGGRPFSIFLKFFLLSHAAAAIADDRAGLDWTPDILHANDWHAGLSFTLLEAMGNMDVGRMFTIHNIAFSGRFPLSYWRLLDGELGQLTGSLFYQSGEFSFLEEALIQADKINTVSPNYAEEIQSRHFGFGFEKLLRFRKPDLTGILNGVDYKVWHPEQDPYLPTRGHGFGAKEKAAVKQEAQRMAGLPVDPDKILCSFTNRLTHQKMADIVIEAAANPELANFQFIFHGNGEARFEKALQLLSNKENVGYIPGFDDKTEHILLAGADICLSPSRFEPCGLNALYAMRYGAVPVVRPVGGYCDSVDNVFDGDPLTEGNGFYMPSETPEGLIAALLSIKSLYDQPTVWQAIVDRAKNMHFSWSEAAQNYVGEYALAQRKRGKARETMPAASALMLLQSQLLAS